MSKNHFTSKEVLLGALLGTLVVSVGATLITGKSSDSTRCFSNICKSSGCKSHDIMDYIIKKGKQLMHMSCREPDWSERAKDFVSEALKGNYFNGNCLSSKIAEGCSQPFPGKDLIIGALAGAAVGAVAGLFMAPKNGDSLRDDIYSACSDMSDKTCSFANSAQKQGKKFAKDASKNADKWFSVAHDILEGYLDTAKRASYEAANDAESYVEHKRHQVEKVVQWATLGYKIWKSLTK